MSLKKKYSRRLLKNYFTHHLLAAVDWFFRDFWNKSSHLNNLILFQDSSGDESGQELRDYWQWFAPKISRGNYRQNRFYFFDKRFFLSASLFSLKAKKENKSKPVFLILLREWQWIFAASKFILNIFYCWRIKWFHSERLSFWSWVSTARFHVTIKSSFSSLTVHEGLFNFAEYRQCNVDYWRGQCVGFKQCSFTNRQGEFLNPEEIVEIRKRIYACSNYGRGFACCEENQIIRATLPPPTTTIRTTTTQQVVIASNVGAFSEDPLLHYNYRLFKDLKCGGSSLNRVAFGDWTCWQLKNIF